MNIQENVDLQALNTLSVPSCAQYFCIAENLLDINKALEWAHQHQQRVQILAGGSNVVLPEFVNGLLLNPAILGRELVGRTADHVLLRFGAGENWHQIVTWCLESGFYGLENLALIPGTVGAAPVQNIGAYGVEIRHFVERVEYLDRSTKKIMRLSADECEFAYRDSIFKNDLKGRIIITHVTLKLATYQNNVVQIDRTQLYPALQQELEAAVELTPQLIYDTVCRIRQKKLPDPQYIPNCGSFFKNPVVTREKFEALQALYADMPSYPAGNQSTHPATSRKLAAAWLIDRAGWKGRSLYGVAVHSLQALVITNPNRCAAGAVLQLAADIHEGVLSAFGVNLEMEPERIA